MAKMHIPESKMTPAIAGGAEATAVKAAGATADKMYRVPIDKLRVIPGFNPRVDSDDYLAHRDTIAARIAANGFLDTKPLSGYVGKDGDENVIFITDGHTRLDAVQTFNADPDTAADREIKDLPVVVTREKPSMTDLTVALHTSNSGRPLTPFELGVVVKRLLAEDGADKENIAKRLAVTPRYLDDVILLAEAPAKVRNHVLAGEVSSTMAIQELRRDPAKAAERITAAVTKATASGKKRATAKDVGPKLKRGTQTVAVAAGTNMKELVKQIAALVREAIPATGEGDEKVSARVGEIKLVIGVEAEPKPKKKKAPAKKAAAAKPAAKPAAKTAPAKKGSATDSDTAKAIAAEADRQSKAAGETVEPEVEEQADDLGIEGVEPVDGDLDLPPPPAVKSDAGGNGDDI
jgi:ParB family chromosome partitioning protein